MIVTMTTDFGTRDGYVGAMKGVILSAAPGATVVDLTHEVPPHDVAAAAFALAQAAPYFPDGTVHVAVVDPGVGGARRCVAIDDGRHRFVGPDNGTFALAVPAPVAVPEITAPAFRRGTVAATFHGRDVFAPAAARLAAGAPVAEAGPAVPLEGRLDGGELAVSADGRDVRGRVIHVDRFGNLVTDVPAARLAAGATVRVGARVVARGLSATYEGVPRGRPLAYVGSAGTLEIAVREGSAASRFRARRGAAVTVTAPREPG
jgi:S-adenosyl-L-methionine hydrolase (adenosine-forming)